MLRVGSAGLVHLRKMTLFDSWLVTPHACSPQAPGNSLQPFILGVAYFRPVPKWGPAARDFQCPETFPLPGLSQSLLL